MSEPQPQQPPNPIVTKYNEWAGRTPFVTRMCLQTIAIVYLLSWFTDFSMLLVNIPYYTILHFEIYRILFSPIFCNSLLSVIFIGMSFTQMGAKLEYALGSTATGVLVLVFALGTNVVFLVTCFFLFICGVPEALFYSSEGFWTIILGFIALECSDSPQPTRQLFFFPVQIPTKYYPIALYCLFSLFTGFRLDMAISITIGYAYAFQKLNFLKPSDTSIARWEQGVLSNFTGKPGYISSGNAQGNAAWIPVNNPGGGGQDSNNSNSSSSGFAAPGQPSSGGGGGGSLGNRFGTFAQPPAGANNNNSSNKDGKPFPGGGSTVGGNSSSNRPADIAQARLQALEKMDRNRSDV